MLIRNWTGRQWEKFLLADTAEFLSILEILRMLLGFYLSKIFSLYGQKQRPLSVLYPSGEFHGFVKGTCTTSYSIQGQVAPCIVYIQQIGSHDILLYFFFLRETLSYTCIQNWVKIILPFVSISYIFIFLLNHYYSYVLYIVY